jgi:hypothetical protein
MPGWILELMLAEVDESRRPADGMGRPIRNRRKGVEGSVRVLAPKLCHQHRQSLARVAPAHLRVGEEPLDSLEIIVRPWQQFDP